MNYLYVQLYMYVHERLKMKKISMYLCSVEIHNVATKLNDTYPINYRFLFYSILKLNKARPKYF
jgi:hypothetical protein